MIAKYICRSEQRDKILGLGQNFVWESYDVFFFLTAEILQKNKQCSKSSKAWRKTLMEKTLNFKHCKLYIIIIIFLHYNFIGTLSSWGPQLHWRPRASSPPPPRQSCMCVAELLRHCFNQQYQPIPIGNTILTHTN